MRMDKLTSRFQQALADSQSLAVGRDHNLIEPVHLLVALLDQQGGSTRPLLSQAGVDVNPLRQRAMEALERLPKVSGQEGVVTVGNDLTMRDVQKGEPNWTRGKGFDDSCPLGPWVETELDPSALSLRTTVDGALRQDGSTADMLRDVATCVSFVSEAITLLPGDVVLTGTPAGVGRVEVGEEVAVTIEGIGTLRTRITAG